MRKLLEIFFVIVLSVTLAILFAGVAVWQWVDRVVYVVVELFDTFWGSHEN